MIVGITGTNKSGKGTIAEFLKTKGFKHYSVKKFIEEKLIEKGLHVDRDNLVLMGNQLRSKHGPSYIVEELYKKAEQEGGDAIIESIRAIGEVEALRNKGHFVLFAIDADPEIRYARIVEQGNNKDVLSYEDFLSQEEREMHSTDPNKQNISGCIELADHFFRNNWTKEELLQKVANVLGNRGPGIEQQQRPTWDEYFMHITRTVALRGTCDREQGGCVIAKDKQILVTGYVGSPKGLPHCDEVGHQMEEWEHSDGIRRTHCVRTTHAEQNAICQAAKRGVAIEGATLYCEKTPCLLCAKTIINAGITRVVCNIQQKQTKIPQKILEQAGITVEFLNKK